tara:strand:- start:548 stop:1060 length:513 start_codon:yes stop_codon:yes gene_type:complete
MSKLYVDELHPKTSGSQVLMPTKPAFSVKGSNAGWTSVTDGNRIVIALDVASINIGNHFNTSSYTFTAPVAGLYQFNGMGYVRNNSGTGSDSGTYGYVQLRKNDSTANEVSTLSCIFGYLNNGDADQVHTVAGIMSLAVGDEVTMHLLSEGGGTSDYYGAGCGLSGYLIG